MRKVILLVLLAAIVFVVYNRQRIYVRDPLGSVMRDGAEEAGTQVYINYSNDVLLENDRPPMYVTLLQHAQPVGLPASLSCLHWLACMTDADIATLTAADPHARIESMSSRTVEYRDNDGHERVVRLH
jgi:hypothetical protein